MKKYVDILEKIEDLIWKLAIYEFEPTNTSQVLLNVIVIKPFQNLFGLLLTVAVIYWVLTGYGIILIVGLYGEGKIMIPLILSLFNIVYLIKYVFNQIIKFREN